MNTKTLTIATTAALMLALTGCATGAATDPTPTETATPVAVESTPTPEPSAELVPFESPEPPVSSVDEITEYPSTGDYYFFGSGRTVGKFSLPTEPDEDLHAAYETLLPGETATYAKVTIDNREGESAYSLEHLTGYGEDGQMYRFVDAASYLDDPLWDMWTEVDVFNEAEYAVYEDVDATVSEFRDYGHVPVGAVMDVWLVYPEADLPESFTQLGVNGGATYFGGSDVLPQDMAEFDLSFEAPAR